MKGKTNFLRMFIFIGVGLLCAGTIQMCSYGYLPWEQAPDRSFPIEVLLIDESAFPPGWEPSINGPRPPANAPLDHYGSIERVELFFYTREQVAFQEVHRFASIRGAIREFKRQKSISFPAGVWVIPDKLTYQSPIADQFYLACSLKSTIPMCGAIGRYEEYLVRFNTHMSSDFMTYSDLERVLEAIDRRMARYLEP